MEVDPRRVPNAMKLCVLMPAHWSGRLGGAEIQVRYLLRHLRETSNHQVTVICRHASMTEDEGATIYRIKTYKPLARYSYLPDYFSVQGLLRQIDPDVVYSRVGSPLVGFAAHYCKRHRKPLVHHIARLDDVLPRAELPAQNLTRNLERRIYEAGLRRADAVIAQAHYQAKLLDKHFNRKTEAVIANYHPAPASAPVKDARERRVVWVANIKRGKRPEAFIELARRCQDLPNTQFIMVGAISDKRYVPLIEQARRLANFRYDGPAPLDDVNRLLDSAHVFVNTSIALGEGFPNSYIQAWLRGTPVLSLEVDPDSLLADGHMGLCSNNSSDQLLHNLYSLLGDPTRLKTMATFVRDEALRHFGSHNLERIQMLLEQHAVRAAA